MKKIYLLVFLSTCISLSIFANGIEIDGIYYLLDNTNYTASVTYPNETTPSWRDNISTYSGTINIPSSVIYGGETYVVTGIGNNAFIGSILTAITLPNTITSIGSAAFCNHKGITTLELPNLLSLGNEAFRWCTTLQKAIIPECINSLGITAFQRCIGLREIQLPDKLTGLPNHFLYACSSLQHITLPSSLKSISAECFRSCASLKSISIPDGVTSLNYAAFRGCESLEKLYIPHNVASIGEEIIGGYPMDPYTGGAVPGYTGVTQLKSVYIDCSTPPTCHTNAFIMVDKSKVRLFVPIGSVDAYKAIPAYADRFKGIYEFGVEASNVMDITDTSALLTWFPDVRVWRYEVKLYQNNVLEQQFLVDENGEIISSQQFAPSVYKHKMDTTNSSTDYFVISLNGLSASTDYNYTIEGKNTENVSVYHEEGSFKTLNEGEEGLFDITSDDPRKQARKILYNGQIYILRVEKIYTLQGQEVK